MSRNKEIHDALAVNEDSIICGGEIVDISHLPDIARPLSLQLNTALKEAEKMLCSAPAFIMAVKAVVPEEIFAAVLTDEQKQKVASGALKLMQKSDGSFLATLVNPSTGKTVANVPLQNIKLSPTLNQAMTDLSTQMQMAQIVEQIESVQEAVADVRRGQENDRLATASSCRQKFLQAMSFQNPELRSSALLRLAMDAEDSRNLLMQSQKENVKFIQGQPKTFWEKLLAGSPPKDIAQHMDEIRDSLYAINAVSLVEAMAYQEMGEPVAATRSLEYYGEHIQTVFLSEPDFVERLDQLDASPACYWSKDIPKIQKQIALLPFAKKNKQMLEGSI